MPDILYFIWALLPILQLIITVKAAGKKVTNTGKREDPKYYSKSLIFSVVALLVAVFIDVQFFDNFADLVEDFGLDSRVPRWLIYPALLTAIAVIQQFFTDKKKKEEEAEQTARRLKYAKKEF